MARYLDVLVFGSVNAGHYPRNDWQAALAHVSGRVVAFLSEESAMPILRHSRTRASIMFGAEAFRGLNVMIRYIGEPGAADLMSRSLEFRIAPLGNRVATHQVSRQLAALANLIGGGLIREAIASDVEVIRRSQPQGNALGRSVDRRRQPINEDLG